MKEYLHLFDEIQNWNPVDKGLFTIYDGKSFYTAQYRARYGSFDLGGGRFISPTHILDLSKLTTKEKAFDAVLDAVSAEVGGLSEQEITGIKIMTLPKL